MKVFIKKNKVCKCDLCGVKNYRSASNQNGIIYNGYIYDIGVTSIVSICEDCLRDIVGSLAEGLTNDNE